MCRLLLRCRLLEWLIRLLRVTQAFKEARAMADFGYELSRPSSTLYWCGWFLLPSARFSDSADWRLADSDMEDSR